ncbi:hypothetical protein ACOME3_008993 [Neoechinorhynchus agilis]
MPMRSSSVHCSPMHGPEVCRRRSYSEGVNRTDEVNRIISLRNTFPRNESTSNPSTDEPTDGGFVPLVTVLDLTLPNENHRTKFPNQSISVDEDEETGAVSYGKTKTAIEHVKTSPPGRDGFCEICKKHFCNKYYLRKHKADVHNLFTDYARVNITKEFSPTNHLVNESSKEDIQDARIQLAPSKVQQQQQHSYFDTSIQHLQSLLETHVTQNLYSHNLLFSGNLATAMINGVGLTDEKSVAVSGRNQEDIVNEDSTMSEQQSKLTVNHLCFFCQQTFPSNAHLASHLVTTHSPHLLHQQRVQSQPIPAAQYSSTLNVNDDRMAQLEMVLGAKPFDHETWTTGNRRPTVGQVASSKLSERVKCDICGKEVCNKYFLKTHKTKVHGVAVENSNQKSGTQDRNKSQVTSCGGVVDASDLPCLNEAERKSLKESGVDPDSYCVLCMKSFCSKYFLRTHQQNMHNVRQMSSSTTIATKRWKLDSATIANDCANSSGSNAPPKPKNHSPAQSRVRCSVCNKDLCNKYFLKSHLQNVHKIEVKSSGYISNNNSNNTNNSEVVTQPVNLTSETKQPESITIPQKRHNDEDKQEFQPKAIKRECCEFSKMQPFIIESDDPLFREKVQRSIIYLPMKSRLHSPVHFNVKLKPVEDDATFQSHNCC